MKNCVELVNTYTDQIIKMFLADYTPEQVCAAVGLCPKRKNSLRLESNSIVSNVIPPVNKNALQVSPVFNTVDLKKRLLSLAQCSGIEFCRYGCRVFLD